MYFYFFNFKQNPLTISQQKLFYLCINQSKNLLFLKINNTYKIKTLVFYKLNPTYFIFSQYQAQASLSPALKEYCGL